jgi:hypothetical protein
LGTKFALIVAAALMVTLVDALVGAVIVAVPAVTVQLENRYPLDAVALMAWAAPGVTGVAPEGVVVPWPSLVTVSVTGINAKFALIVAAALIVTVVAALVGVAMVAVPAVTVQLEN